MSDIGGIHANTSMAADDYNDATAMVMGSSGIGQRGDLAGSNTFSNSQQVPQFRNPNCKAGEEAMNTSGKPPGESTSAIAPPASKRPNTPLGNSASAAFVPAPQQLPVALPVAQQAVSLDEFTGTTPALLQSVPPAIALSGPPAPIPIPPALHVDVNTVESAATSTAPQSTAAARQRPQPPKIYVRNLPAHITEAMLRNAFSPWGEIYVCQLTTERSGTGICAYITYETEGSVQLAVQHANGTQPFGVSSQPLSVRPAETLEARNRRMERRNTAAAGGRGGTRADAGQAVASAPVTPHNGSSRRVAQPAGQRRGMASSMRNSASASALPQRGRGVPPAATYRPPPPFAVPTPTYVQPPPQSFYSPPPTLTVALNAQPYTTASFVPQGDPSNMLGQVVFLPGAMPPPAQSQPPQQQPQPPFVLLLPPSFPNSEHQ